MRDPLELARPVLRRALDAPVRLVDAQLLRAGGRSTVWRCRVLGQTGRDIPATVVVKCLESESSLWRTEWATLAFLGGIKGTAGLVPHLYGGDVAGRVVVMEDLGGGGSLDAILRHAGRTDGVTAVQTACLALAEAYARLHTATVGQEAAFTAACRGVPDSLPEGRVAEAARWRAGLVRMRAWMDATGCPVPTGLDAACDLVAASYVTPGPYLALTHGDPAPTNTHVGAAPDDVHLLDFEYAGYRHALYDLTAWEVLCPLPRAMVGAMRGCYQSLVTPTISRQGGTAGPGGTAGTGGAAGFAAAWASMVAFRALAILSWVPLAVLEQNGPWVEDWTGREAILAAVGRLARTAEGADAVRPISVLAASLETRLRRRWPEYDERETLPRWPALTG